MSNLTHHDLDDQTSFLNSFPMDANIYFGIINRLNNSFWLEFN